VALLLLYILLAVSCGFAALLHFLAVYCGFAALLNVIDVYFPDVQYVLYIGMGLLERWWNGYELTSECWYADLMRNGV
jgi:hypothetical protein